MTDPAHGMHSNVTGAQWPALPGARGAELLALLFQLDATQWWPAERLLAHQLRQLTVLLRHARDTVPFYRERLAGADLRPDAVLTPGQWRALPLLTKADIQRAGDALLSREIPREYGRTMEVRTSGSTGQPVKVRGTQLDHLVWQAMTLRDLAWHPRDLAGKLAVIRANTGTLGAPPHGTDLPDWGPPVSTVFRTGPAALLSLAADIGTQYEWLTRQAPDYLLTYPNNLNALIRHFSGRGGRPRKLKGVRTIGETVTPELRAACREEWGLSITDCYTSQETGYLALQCPQGERYHVAAESALVEILDAADKPCRPGEVGRLVVTPLHNFAMPLVRYDLGDHAEAGAPCSCGRGLPTIARILGRSRNILTLPTGERRYPLVGFYRYRDIAPIRQYQLIQHTLEEIEVRFAVERALTRDEETRLTRVIQEALGHPFRLAFVYFDGEIPRGPGGKFEDFISHIEQGERAPS